MKNKLLLLLSMVFLSLQCTMDKVISTRESESQYIMYRDSVDTSNMEMSNDIIETKQPITTDGDKEESNEGKTAIFFTITVSDWVEVVVEDTTIHYE